MGALQQDREAGKMRKDLGQKGFIKGIIGLFLLIALILAGVTFARPYYRYYSLGSHTRDFLRTEIGNVETIRKNIMKDAAELDVPLDEKDVSVTLVQKIIKVKATWTDTVDLWGLYQTNVDFVMEEEY
jgi:hypothetical protein